MSDTRGMLQAAPIRIELLIKNEANQNRNKKVIIIREGSQTERLTGYGLTFLHVGTRVHFYALMTRN
jgi:hypothetical protein